MQAEHQLFQELGGDQARELVNTEQRYRAVVDAHRQFESYRGSMSFALRRGVERLLRDYYDPKSGVKRQKSLGPRSAETEALASQFSEGKARTAERLKEAESALKRQSAVNRALRLGRVPDIGARIVRALDASGLLGRGMRVVGTNALFAYEAAAGIHLASDVTTTEDIDILFDARASLRFAAEQDVHDRTLIGLLKRVDRTFEKTDADFQARNASGYLVDLIRPARSHPWREESASPSDHSGDLSAAQIDGLIWHENAPPFESVAIDSKGAPVRLVAPDPRAFVVHKLWLSKRTDRNPLKRRRDLAQARSVAALTAQYLTHLPFEEGALRSFPKALVEEAAPLFAQ